MLPGAAWGQAAATLPEVTVTAPRPAAAPVRRAAPAASRPVRSAAPAAPAAVSGQPAFQVVAPTPVPGIGFDRNKVPAMVQTLTAEDFARVYSPNVVETLAQRIPGVVTTDVQGNGFFQRSALSRLCRVSAAGHPARPRRLHAGYPHQRSLRRHRQLGFDPDRRHRPRDIWTNNPAFGLNALGGAVSLQMKDGFTYRGVEFDASGGSYGRVGGSIQYGVRNGEWGLYLAAEGFKDDGWRYQSPSRLARFYGDLGWKGTDAEIHLVTSVADNFFGVVGPTPIELLNNDYRAIYTWPQTTKNQAQLLALNGRYAVTDHWTI